MKKTKYLAILAIVTVICIIIGTVIHITHWFGYGFSNLFSFVSSTKLDHSRVTYSENISEFNEIEIEASVMSITIKPGDSYSLTYDCVKYLEPDFKVKGNKFTLSQPSVPHFGGSNNKCNMTLTIPAGIVLNNIDILSDIGNIKINDSNSSNIKLESDIGNITLENCKFENSEIQCDIGNIKLNTCSLGDSELENDTGNINVSECEFEDLDAYNDVGNVEFKTSLTLDNYDIDLLTDIGTIKFNGEKQKKHFSQKASNTSDAYELNIETDIGNIIFN